MRIQMEPTELLEEIYKSIGNGAEVTDALLDRIAELEAIGEPKICKAIEEVTIEGVCGDPYCNGKACWECAAIRAGSPMDA